MHFSLSTRDCVDPAMQVFHSQGTSGKLFLERTKMSEFFFKKFLIMNSNCFIMIQLTESE